MSSYGIYIYANYGDNLTYYKGRETVKNCTKLGNGWSNPALGQDINMVNCTKVMVEVTQPWDKISIW